MVAQLASRPSLVFPLVRELTLTALVLLVPLIFLPSTSELFEYNKMYLTYAIAAVLLFAEIGSILIQDKPTFKKPALALVGAVFLAGLTVTAFRSIDTYVSLFGFYGRFYGGLFSYLALTIIFYSVSQLSRNGFLSLVKASLAVGLIISVWGILEHFGHSPSCLLLDQTFGADCWVQDVQARVFATLGQPNWLAAYLAMLLPWAVTFYLENKSRLGQVGFFLLAMAIFTCFIFTFSRGGNYGLLAGLAILVFVNLSYIKKLLPRILPLAFAMAAVTIIFATPLGQQFLHTPSPRQTGTLESGDETGNIRLIVWRGAWEIFKANPIFGSGLDTFGESFYQYRPVEMNRTSEWDFLFNRAHNEYLNFLATTGLIGTLPYLTWFGLFLLVAFRLSLKTGPNRWLHSAALASTATYLVQNIFSFTVVPLAVLLVLNLASLNLTLGREIAWTWSKNLRPKVRLGAVLALTVPALVSLVTVFNFWRADLYYARGLSDNQTGSPESAAQELTQALSLNPYDPNYVIQLSFAQSNLAGQSLSDEDDAAGADSLAKLATTISPHNLSLWRLRSQVYENLLETDPQYFSLALGSRQQATRLAPTDPQVRFELGQFYQKNNQFDQAITEYLASTQLKDDYIDPLKELTKIYLDRNDTGSAKIYLIKLQQIAPSDPEVISLSQKAGL